MTLRAARAGLPSRLGVTMAEFPRCAECRVVVEPGQNVVFRLDGRVAHSQCPPVSCPLCQKPIAPGHPIRRDRDDALVHGNCWWNLARSQDKRNPGVRRFT